MSNRDKIIVDLPVLATAPFVIDKPDNWDSFDMGAKNSYFKEHMSNVGGLSTVSSDVELDFEESEKTVIKENQYDSMTHSEFMEYIRRP